MYLVKTLANQNKNVFNQLYNLGISVSKGIQNERMYATDIRFI